MIDIFYTYILYSESHNRFYIGQTSNIKDRLNRHNSGHEKSTKPFTPWKIIGHSEKNSRSEAMILEKKLKNLNSEDLLKFIDKYFDKVF
jgi:putative endonuclease